MIFYHNASSCICILPFSVPVNPGNVNERMKSRSLWLVHINFRLQSSCKWSRNKSQTSVSSISFHLIGCPDLPLVTCDNRKWFCFVLTPILFLRLRQCGPETNRKPRRAFFLSFNNKKQATIHLKSTVTLFLTTKRDNWIYKITYCLFSITDSWFFCPGFRLSGNTHLLWL